jgi:hypothetical protein
MDPLAHWRNQFAEWRKDVSEFRVGELRFFFPNRDKEIIQRTHRGWLCALISSGEFLAVQLLQAEQDAGEDLELLNLCLENLRDTLQTWHFTEPADLIRSSVA